MLKIGNTQYYIDLDALADYVTSKNNDETYSESETYIEISDDNTYTPKSQRIMTKPRPKELELSKFEVIRDMLEIIYSYNEDLDDSLGTERALNKTTISFKIAFNTLQYYGILKTL